MAMTARRRCSGGAHGHVRRAGQSAAAAPQKGVSCGLGARRWVTQHLPVDVKRGSGRGGGGGLRGRPGGGAGRPKCGGVRVQGPVDWDRPRGSRRRHSA